MSPRSACSRRTWMGQRSRPLMVVATVVPPIPASTWRKTCCDAQPVAPEQLAPDLDLQVGLALHPGRRDAGRPLDPVDHPLDLEGLLLQGVEVVAEDLDPDLGADAGAGHEDAVLDGLEEAGHIAGHVHQPLGEVGDDGRLGGPRRPLRLAA